MPGSMRRAARPLSWEAGGTASGATRASSVASGFTCPSTRLTRWERRAAIATVLLTTSPATSRAVVIERRRPLSERPLRRRAGLPEPADAVSPFPVMPWACAARIRPRAGCG
nr:hypothetical protein GCM10020093_070180 [Planobispora longispora]